MIYGTLKKCVLIAGLVSTVNGALYRGNEFVAFLQNDIVKFSNGTVQYKVLNVVNTDGMQVCKLQRCDNPHKTGKVKAEKLALVEDGKRVDLRVPRTFKKSSRNIEPKSSKPKTSYNKSEARKVVASQTTEKMQTLKKEQEHTAGDLVLYRGKVHTVVSLGNSIFKYVIAKGNVDKSKLSKVRPSKLIIANRNKLTKYIVEKVDTDAKSTDDPTYEKLEMGHYVSYLDNIYRVYNVRHSRIAGSAPWCELRAGHNRQMGLHQKLEKKMNDKDLKKLAPLSPNDKKAFKEGTLTLVSQLTYK